VTLEEKSDEDNNTEVERFDSTQKFKSTENSEQFAMSIVQPLLQFTFFAGSNPEEKPHSQSIFRTFDEKSAPPDFGRQLPAQHLRNLT